MRKILVEMGTGFCGSDGYDTFEVADTALDKDIDSIAWSMAVENAEMYGYEVGCYCEDLEDEYTSDMIDYGWDDYDPETHDQYL